MPRSNPTQAAPMRRIAAVEIGPGDLSPVQIVGRSPTFAYILAEGRVPNPHSFCTDVLCNLSMNFGVLYNRDQ